jgi:hypothetical protein
MLGESIETSAGDPTRAGQAKREVGTNCSSGAEFLDEGNRVLATPAREPGHAGLHPEHRPIGA